MALSRSLRRPGVLLSLAVLTQLPARADAPTEPATPETAAPQPPAGKRPEFNFLVGGGLEFGGGDVATVAFTDGSSQDVHAGQGISGFVGGQLRLHPQSPWSARVTAGYKYVTTKASNANIGLGRVPLEFIGSYRFGNGARVGSGLVYHTAIKLNGDGFFEDVKFKDAVGFRVEAGWRWILLSYTGLDYKARNGGGSTDASSVGVNLIVGF